VIKSRRGDGRGMWYVTEKGNEYRVLMGKPEVSSRQVSTIILDIKLLEQIYFLRYKREYHTVSNKDESVSFCNIDTS
jgi:hypothetical protein